MADNAPETVSERLFVKASEAGVDPALLPHEDRQGGTKVTVVGVGQVGMACAFTILQSQLCRTLCLLDIAVDKVKGEVLDLSQGTSVSHHVKVIGGDDYALSAGSDVVIVSAGVRQREGESRLDLLGRNVRVFQSIVPLVAQHSPDCTIIVVANPVDILTYVTWKLSGFPASRVMGSGTTLDTSRFRQIIAERFDVDPASVHGFIIGEHGDSSVAVWSGVSVGGVRLIDIDAMVGQPVDGTESTASTNAVEDWSTVEEEVRQSAHEVIALKGYTSWAIGLCVGRLTKAVLTDERRVFPVSTLVRGLHGIDHDVFLSLPCVVDGSGVRKIIVQHLTPEEKAKLNASADTLWELAASVDLSSNL